MENKQKQIEEMAKSMLEYGMEKYPTENSVCSEEILRKKFFYVFLTYAEHLYNAGYRKIPENSVVLTEEEWTEHYEQFAQSLYQKEANTRKETAEKFAEMAKELLDKQEKGWSANMIWISTAKNCIDEICKELLEDNNGKV